MSKRNENRPGYKRTEVGWIPVEWDCFLFRECCSITRGQVDPTDVRYADMKHIGPENIESGTGRLVGVRTARDLGLKSGKYLFDQKAVVYSKIRPNLNKVCMPPYEGLCSADCYPIRPLDGIHRNHLFYYLQSDILLRQSVPVSLRTGMPKINREDLNSLYIIVPPLFEQKKIASILSTWDQIIEQTRKVIDAKRCRKKALMQQLLSGKKRLYGSTASWSEYRLGDLFTKRDETNNTHLPLLAITASRGVIPANEIDRKDASAQDKSNYKRIAPGDIGYNTMRMWQGVSAVSNLEGIVSPAYTVCVPNMEVDVRFMGYLFKFPPVVHSFFRHSQGLVSDTWNLKFPHFAQIKVRIPGLDEQRRIAEVLSTVDYEIQGLEKGLTALERQKRGLMQKLLTGEVRVKI